MNKIKDTIGYADYSWNPITGCRRGCEYCYARKIANRFGEIDVVDPSAEIMVCNVKKAFPFKFFPTYYPGRLDDPKSIKKPSTIFVCDMGDMFGPWVPDVYVEEILEASNSTPQHTFLSLTKYLPWTPLPLLCDWPLNWWFGVSVTQNSSVFVAQNLMKLEWTDGRRWVSFEPLLEGIKDLRFLRYFDGVVIGAMTGCGEYNFNEAWVDRIIEECEKHSIPVYIKSNLLPYYKGEMLKNTAWG
jgi:protein gp37